MLAKSGSRQVYVIMSVAEELIQPTFNREESRERGPGVQSMTLGAAAVKRPSVLSA